MRFVALSVAFHAALAVFAPPYPGRDAARTESTVTVEVYDLARAGNSIGDDTAGKGHPGQMRPAGSIIEAAPPPGPHKHPACKENSTPEEPSARAAMADLEHLRYVVPNTGKAQDPIPTITTLPESYGTAFDGGGHGPSESAGDGATRSTGDAYALAGRDGGEAGAGLYRGFGEGSGPGIVRLIKPVYPPFAKRLNKKGRVVLAISIDEDGSLDGVTVEKPAGYGFDEAAVEAVRKSSFVPATTHGRPVACIARLTVRFELEGTGL